MLAVAAAAPPNAGAAAGNAGLEELWGEFPLDSERGAPAPPSETATTARRPEPAPRPAERRPSGEAQPTRRDADGGGGAAWFAPAAAVALVVLLAAAVAGAAVLWTSRARPSLVPRALGRSVAGRTRAYADAAAASARDALCRARHTRAYAAAAAVSARDALRRARRTRAYAAAAAASAGDALRRARRLASTLQPATALSFTSGRPTPPATGDTVRRAEREGRGSANEPAAATTAAHRDEHETPEATPARARPAAERRDEAQLLRQKRAADPATDPLRAKVQGRPSAPKTPERPADEAILKEKLVTEQAPPKPALAAVDTVAEPEVARLAPRRVRRAECEVRWWRGYLTSQFVAIAENRDGTEVTIAASPFFNWRKREPPPEKPVIASALRTLVESLERHGWTVSGHGDDWFSVRLEAPVAAERIQAMEGEA